MNTLILNPSTILGFAATVITCTGMGLKNPYVAFTGFNLGMSAGIVNTSNKKSKDKQTQQFNSQISFLTNQIKDIENQTQEQHQISSQYQQTLQELKSQQKQALEQVNNNTTQLNSLDPCKLNFKLNNRERQLDEHNKKLKRYQHELNSQKANQNKIFSQIQKLNNEIQRLNNEQKESSTIKAQQLNEIEKQVDKLIDNIQQNLIESNIQFPEEFSNAITEPIYNDPNTIVYIDGNNLYNCLAKIDIQVDYQSLLIELFETINATQIKIYDGAFPNQINKYSELRSLGYQVFTFPIVQREENVYKTVGDDVQMAIDMVKEVKTGDRIVLITGDGDFYPALKEIKQRNVHITVIAENQSISHYLKELADEFISVNSFEYKIARHTRVYT